MVRLANREVEVVRVDHLAIDVAATVAAVVVAVPNMVRLLVFHHFLALEANVDLLKEEDVYLVEEEGHPCSRRSNCLDPFHLEVVVLLVGTFP